MQHGPLSARGEPQSHPLAGQAQACGRSTQVDRPGGPDGTCRGHWLIPLLKKKIDYISRFVHVILAPVHAILLCIIQAGNSPNYVRHPYAGALLSSARADVEIFLRRHCRRRSKKNWQELRPMYRQDSVSPKPSYITARQQFPESAIHSSKLHTQKKKKRRDGEDHLKKQIIFFGAAIEVYWHLSTSFASAISSLLSTGTTEYRMIEFCEILQHFLRSSIPRSIWFAIVSSVPLLFGSRPQKRPITARKSFCTLFDCL